MKKIAIFVEGQTELIFVREFLLKWFDYQIDLMCRKLLAEEGDHEAEYNFPNPSALLHVRITNVGMDGNVVTRMLQREQYLYSTGYELLIGLRDMYSEEYRKKAGNQTINITLNNRIRQLNDQIIQDRAKRPSSIQLCFAIMELESWWIGIPSLWQNIDRDVIDQHNEQFAYPESIFHPAVFLKEIFRLTNKIYSKRKDEVESIVSRISREAYIDLHESQRCPSFCEFVQHIQSSLIQP